MPVKVKAYQLWSLATVIEAVVFTVAWYHAHAHATDITRGLEPAILGCFVGACGMGARPINARYNALGRNTAAARADPDYMHMRRVFQFSLIPAVAGMSAVAAARFGVDVLLAWVATPVLLAAAVVATNRLSGFTAP